MMKSKLPYVLAITAGLGLGCGWLNENLTRITFNLPKKSFSIDAGQFNLPPGGVPAVPCGAGGVADCCDPAPGMAPPIDCAMHPLTCQEPVCALAMPVDQASMVNLGMEVPDLKRFSGQKAATIDLKSLIYDIVNNLNTDLPALDLYIGPGDAKAASDPRARKLGTIPLTAAGSQNTGAIVLDADGRAAFRQFALDFDNPFAFIAGGTVVVQGGAPKPAGQADITIGGQGEASLNVN